VKRKGKISKLLSVVVSAAMALSCFSGVAFADPETTSTYTIPEVDGHTFEVFQVFTGDVNDNGVGSNLKWGINGKGTTESGLTQEQQTAIQNLSSESEGKIASTIANTYADLTSTPYNGIESRNVIIAPDGSNGYKITNLPAGYYLIRDKEMTQNQSTYTLYVCKVSLSSNNTLTFQIKSDTPYVDKYVSNTSTVGTDTYVSASLNQQVYYELDGHVSDLIGDYGTYYYKFTDSLSKGLDLYTDDSNNNDVKVYIVNGDSKIDATNYFYIGTAYKSKDDKGELTVDASADTRDATVLTVAIKDLKALSLVKDSGNSEKYIINKDTIVRVEYSAKLNKNAVVTDGATGGNPNTVNVTYSNDPNNSGTGTTNPPSGENPPSEEPNPDTPTGTSVDKTARVYTAALQIVKQDANANRLTGATFGLLAKGNEGTLTEVLTTKVTYVAADEGTDSSIQKYYKLKDGTFVKVSDEVNSEDRADTVEYIVSKTEVSEELITVATANSEQTASYYQQEVGSDGVVVFQGLGAGKYTLSEVVSPSGFNRITDQEIVLVFDKNTQKFTISGIETGLSSDAVDGVFTYYCENKVGSALPTTGGIGTTIFYVVGTILVLGAGIALVTRRRMRKETRQL
jgi:LPXTG-motif cell wall-anchored protein